MPQSRREFLASLAAAPAARAATQSSAPANRPNIIVIMADDLGFSDIGCYGSEIRTPNLDDLASRGVRFTHYYNAARCCPTRAALLTGLYPHQAGVGSMIGNLGLPSYQGYLNDRCVTFAEALKPAGYHPLMVGKWHVGEERPYWPTDRGFERYFGLISGASNYFRLEPGRKMAMEAEPYTPGEKFYMTDAFSDHAVRLVDEYGRKQSPYFLYLAYTAPHWPLHALPEDIARYRGKYKRGWDVLRQERHARQLSSGIVERRWPLTPRDPTVPAWADVANQDDYDLRMAVYAAQIDRMDQGIGRVLAKVRQLGQEDNTFVIFMADNGGCHEELDRGTRKGAPVGAADSFTSYGRPWANASNTPFRMYKHWVHEGGIASPLIARWPSAMKRTGSLFHGTGHVTDIMPTVLDAAGAEYPRKHGGKEITPLPGKSLLPAFKGEPSAPREWVFWEHQGNRAVRQGHWKLVSRFPGRWELYDIAADRTELRDLAPEEPGRVQQMIAAYDDWARRCGVVPWESFKGKR